MRKIILVGGLVFVLGGGAVFFYFNHSARSNSYATMHDMHHGKSGGASQGMMQGHMHDEMTMPGLQGKDTTDTEVADLKRIFQQHMEIERRVTNLPNGISTFTASNTPEVREAIVSHVSMMVTRLAEGKNPEVIIQSPTLDALFDVHHLPHQRALLRLDFTERRVVVPHISGVNGFRALVVAQVGQLFFEISQLFL